MEINFNKGVNLLARATPPATAMAIIAVADSPPEPLVASSLAGAAPVPAGLLEIGESAGILEL